MESTNRVMIAVFYVAYSEIKFDLESVINLELLQNAAINMWFKKWKSPSKSINCINL